MRIRGSFTIIAICVLVDSSCNKQINSELNEVSSIHPTVWQTKCLGDKEPMVAVYIETNDTNPLNAGDYFLDSGIPFYDCVQLFSANIHKQTVGGIDEPTLYFNPMMVNIFENGGVETYIERKRLRGYVLKIA